MEPVDFDEQTCPLQLAECERILLGHGSGGKLSANLLHNVFLAGYGNDALLALEDQAAIPISPGTNPLNKTQSARIAMTTDSYVVRPLFFPGGDIGTLAVHGTVNDLAVGGAIPLCLSAAFILEEGLPMSDLQRIVASMREACASCGVRIVTGDTKVVDRGKADGVFITTTGIGHLPEGLNLSVRNAQPGDCVLVSGTLGDHGMAIMSVREGLEFETILTSDTAPLSELAQLMLATCPTIRWMRDPTRGGLASALNELAQASQVGVCLRETQIPLRREVRAACELLGLDPLYVASEGRLVAVAPAGEAPRILAAMQQHPLGRDAAIIGEIVDDHHGLVVLRSVIGGSRVVSMLSGEQLPRIC